MGTRRVSRGCLVSLALLVVLALAAIFLVRRALDPESLRGLAESRLSAILGQPVSIGRMDWSLWPSPAVEGREIRVGAGTASQAPSVSLTALRIVPRLSSVFSRPLVVERVEVDGLAVRALRDRAGKWSLPLPAIAGDGGAASPGVDVGRILLENGSLVVIDEGRAVNTSAPPGFRHVEAAMRLTGGVAMLERLTATVADSTIAGHGTASAAGLRLALEWQSLTPGDLPEVFALLGSEAPAGLAIVGQRPLTVDMTVDAQGVMTASGRLQASKVALGTLTLTSLASPLRLAGTRLSLDPLTFSLYGGHERGVFTVDAGASPAVWTSRSAITGVDVNELLSSNTSAKNKLSGSARLTSSLRGTTASPIERTMTGTIAVQVANGVVHDFPLLASLNSALRLGTSGNDKDLRFDSLSATMQVDRGVMTTDDLVATSGDLTLNAAGTLRFDLALDLTGTARFTREKSDDLVRRAKDLGGLRNPQGLIEVPFSVKGTAASPAFAVDIEKVLERAASKELKRQLDRQLKKWIKIR